VAPLWKVGVTKQPRAREVAPKTVVATALTAPSKIQIIWTPAPKLAIERDLPLPNLIATKGGAVQEDIPKALPKAATPRKVFVPAVVPPKQPALPVMPSTIDAPAPTVANGAGMTAPALSGSSQWLSAIPGDAKVDLAVASLHPATAGSLPEGVRPGNFSQAPETGKPATGDLDASAKLRIPNLTTREVEKPPAPAVPRAAILYAERVRSVPVSTLSVPLRPSARAIPRGVEFRFQGRFVYTVVVPIENFPDYSGDWIIWFAESEQRPGNAPMVRAPLPYRKLEAVRTGATAGRTEQRVQFAAIIRQDGHLDHLQLLSRAAPAVAAAVQEDLASWEFKPASRDGLPIDVEVVIEIPFSLPAPVNVARP
jgi:hypothetical protein